MFWFLNILYFILETLLLYFIQFTTNTRSVEDIDKRGLPVCYFLVIFLLVVIIVVDIKKLYKRYKEKQKIMVILGIEFLFLILPFVTTK